MRLIKLSLRNRIFISMILLVLGASILIVGVTVYQYKQESEAYHRERLERKEQAIRENIKFVLASTTHVVNTQNLPVIMKDRQKIHEISQVHDMQLNIYDLSGKLLIQSNESFFRDTSNDQIPPQVLKELESSSRKRYLRRSEVNGQVFQSSYSYLNDNQFKPLAILYLPYLQDDELLQKDLNDFLMKMAEVYLFMLVLAILLSYFLSKYITKSLKMVSEKIVETRLDKKNQKIEIENASEEIYTLVAAYNSMIDDLEESAVKLATGEREQAWREMAKQVAHEIKNPLTPMRLSVQSFQRNFDPNDPEIKMKVEEYSNTLIHQIDTMSAIASAFSNFAKMPAQQNEILNVPKIVKLALDIFNEEYIIFSTEKEEILAKFDRTQLIRVVTNLVKNATQALQDIPDPKILVRVEEVEDMVSITVSDNGVGIAEENKEKVFEPKFTTKSSGMGLGLAMVKNLVETYGGSITFTSKRNKGTIFTVKFPK
ncbi:GHKL domain-containing protein [Antarcticibacterium flavum]|uniref:histidine kinase n=1 Tax=Antarcticibacterium flavum TaxID=2058175 RepID=A0A5B7X2W5_9FLAO|nr:MULTISPECIES: ATP-binding protein [Antarcticibacterium]MCM4160592.1 two-component sensor histidine kinase [Antarcticibacterium sp. W02-3]QCY69747.1 GHKL domain-containing protein [Antarcticibacterium flavum]